MVELAGKWGLNSIGTVLGMCHDEVPISVDIYHDNQSPPYSRIEGMHENAVMLSFLFVFFIFYKSCNPNTKSVFKR